MASDCAAGKMEQPPHCWDGKKGRMLLLINANWYQTEVKHLARRRAGQYTIPTSFIQSAVMQLMSLRRPAHILNAITPQKRSILFLLSLLMNRFAASTRGSLLRGILAGRDLDRWSV